MFFLFTPLALIIELAAAAVYVWLRCRRLRTGAVTNALSLLAGQNLPLGEGLRAMAGGERGATRRILEEIAARLDVGESVATAVRSAHPSIPGDVLGAIQAGEAAGTLPTALRSIDQRVRERETRAAQTTPIVLYISLLAIFVLVHLFLMTTFLAPQFRDIFKDYGMRELPWATEVVFTLVSDLNGRFAPVGWLIWIAPLLIIGYVGIGRNFLVRVPDRVQPLFRMLEALSWYCPGLRRIAQTRALARQLPLLAASVRAGHGLPAAAMHAARTDANWFSRRRLERWSEAMTAGESPAQAARDAGLPAPLRRLAATSRSSEELLAEISYLAAYYERLAFHWERIVTACVTPLLVLIASIVVGFVVVSLFLPMQSLMESLMSEVY